MELDHVILFVTGPADARGILPGCALDVGQRHDGQGTRNRRAVFARSYVEILWIEEPGEERRSGLRLGPRCAATALCPFGVVLRGRVPDDDRGRFVPYQVPDGGPLLLLLRSGLDNAGSPFVAVSETAGPRHDVLSQAGDAGAIRRVTLRCPAVPDLGAARVRGVEFEAGPARVRLEVEGADRSWVVTGRSGHTAHSQPFGGSRSR